MNKIQSACIFQTILFTQKTELNLPKDDIIKANKAEISQCLKGLDNLHIRYQMTDEKIQEDGSIVIKLRKQQDYITDVKSYFKKQKESD